MPRFTFENTQGYDATALDDLNTMYEGIVNNLDLRADDLTTKAQQDKIAERLLVAYDDGLRGERLFLRV